jgi:hypothetical protein
MAPVTLLLAVVLVIVAMLYLASARKQVKRPDVTPIHQEH